MSPRPRSSRPVPTGAATRDWTVDELTGRPHPFQADLSEAAFQAQVTRLCKTLGLLCYHTHDSRRSTKGFPDLVIVGRGGYLFAELKKATGRLSADQRIWLAHLEAAGAEVHLWRPADLPDITRRLHALAQTPRDHDPKDSPR